MNVNKNVSLDDINRGRKIPLIEGDYDFKDDYTSAVLSKELSKDEHFSNSPTFSKEWTDESYAGYYCPKKVLVLTTPGTFSAGFLLALRLYRAGALLVGTPSGQAPNFAAAMLDWSLTNTRIAGSVSKGYALNLPGAPETERVLRVNYPLTFDLLKRYNFDPNAEVLFAIDILTETEGNSLGGLQKRSSKN